MSRLVTTALFVLCLGACGDIGAPLRSDFYEWRTFTANDTIAFHWPRDSMPLRVWVKDTMDFPAHAAEAIQAWEDAMLYQEFNAELTDDSATAHITIQPGFPPAGGVLLTTITECEALTYLDLDTANRDLRLPVQIFMVPRFDPSRDDTQRCFTIALMHEMGHALGILRHSPNPADIMYFNPTAEVLSARDRTVAELLYHTPATINLIGGSL